MHVFRAVRTFLPILAVLALGGCTALRGMPDFPTGLLLPGDAQALLQTPPAAPAHLPKDCDLAAQWDDAPGVPDASGVLVKQIAYPGTSQPMTIDEATYDSYRNHCIFAYIGAIDLSYNLYKQKTVNLSGNANAAADITVLGLNAAGTAIGAKETKTILSGIATLVGGAKTSIDSDVLYNNSILAVIAKMDADRSQQLGIILQRIQNNTTLPSASAASPEAPVQKLASASIQQKVSVTTPATTAAPATTTTITTTPAQPAPAAVKPAAATATAPAQLPYSMYQASVDLVAYYEAGTFAHALVSLQESAGAQATSCKAQVNNLKTTGTKSGSAAGDALAVVSPNQTSSSGGC